MKKTNNLKTEDKMTNLTTILKGFRELANQDGEYQIVIKGTDGIKRIKAFNLTIEKANDWQRYFKNSVIEKMN